MSVPPAKYANLYKFALLANLKNYEYSYIMYLDNFTLSEVPQ